MTEAQWLFEYHALRKKEEREVEMQSEVLKAHARILFDTLVGVSGADLLVTTKERAAAPEGTRAFVPWVKLFSNHHLLHAALEEQKKEDDAQRALSDAAFDEFSRKLAKGEVGDLDPLLLGNLPGGGHAADRYAEQAAQEMLRVLGVKPRPEGAPVVPHYNAPRRGGVTVSMEGEERLLQQGADAIPRPLTSVGPSPVPLPEGATVQVIELEPGVFGGED